MSFALESRFACVWFAVASLAACTGLKDAKNGHEDGGAVHMPDGSAAAGGASGSTHPGGGGGSGGSKSVNQGGAGGHGGAGGAGGKGGSGGSTSGTGGKPGGAGADGGDDGGPADAGHAGHDDTGIAHAGDPCTTNNQAACDGHASRNKLICFHGEWTPNGSCDGDTRCQSDAASSELGNCLPIASACVGKAAGDVVCDGAARQICGVDLVDYQDDACPPHASCQLAGQDASCICDAPYMDDGAGGCTVPICQEMPCANGGICSLAAVGRSCDCSQVDYEGESCETKIDDCQLDPCSHGTCIDGVRSRTCDCSAVDYDGTDCQTKRDDCALDPCSHGTCTDGVRSRTCDCSAVDYDGTDCQTKRDDCALNPCAHGTCTDGNRTRTCACPAGFSGTSCSTNNNECTGSNVCSSSSNGVYTFACVDYTGDTAGYTCRGQYPDWTVPTFGVGRFSYSSGVVTDNQTGLQWQQSPMSPVTWTAAKTACPSGWRLPTVTELLSIVDYANEPPIDTGSFSTAETYYWTASPVAGSPNFAWAVSFSDGTTSGLNNTGPSEYGVRCVR